jgi:hypothetical protein
VRLLGVVGYTAAVVLRSFRWLPPLLLYGIFVVSATAGGPPLLDALHFAGAALVPAGAWLARVCLVTEPGAARACVAAAVGPVRTQLAALLTAAGFVVLAATVTCLVLALLGDPAGQLSGAPLWRSAATGWLSQLACALTGVAVAAVANPPLLNNRAAATLVTAGGVVLALVLSFSPVYRAVSADGAAAAGIALAWAAGLGLLAAICSCLGARRAGWV